VTKLATKSYRTGHRFSAQNFWQIKIRKLAKNSVYFGWYRRGIWGNQSESR